MLLGVDTGGTFTDFVLFDGSSLRIHKVLSTPEAPERAILQGIKDLAADTDNLSIIHGSTVATNAVLEGKGVSTVFVTNHGLGDLLFIGRQARKQLYNLQPEQPVFPVKREYCLETGGRIGADGEVIEALTDEQIETLIKQIEMLAPQSVAINLLFSFLDDSAEKKIEQRLTDKYFVSRSSEVLPEYREYERGMTTYLNAWVGPLVQGYLQRLKKEIKPAPVSVMQSSGGTIDADQAGTQAVRMLLSGPAGGLAGAHFVARSCDRSRLMTFDIGGTSTDVALIDGDIQLTSEGRIADYPVAIPMVDMHTIGAGGGSIASVDSGGMLQVGPESAGANPGPACYGRNGQHATVTDANLILGRLLPDVFLGGAMTLDVDSAETVLTSLAHKTGLNCSGIAEGIIQVANEHMAAALRVISVQRGHDPRDFTLVSFGGAGGLHVCALADALEMKEAIVPIYAGVLSALGMLVAPRARDISHTVTGLLDSFTEGEIEHHFDTLSTEGMLSLAQEGIEEQAVTRHYSLDCRYRGQSYTLNIPWNNIADTTVQFHKAHEQRFGHKLDQQVELVNLRIALRADNKPIKLNSLSMSGRVAEPVKTAKVYGIKNDVPVWSRDDLQTAQIIDGPALITEQVSTTWLAPGWQCKVHSTGNLILNKK